MAWGFLPFEEAREYARSLKLKSSKEWFTFCKSKDFPNNIPKRPEKTYANDDGMDIQTGLELDVESIC